MEKEIKIHNIILVGKTGNAVKKYGRTLVETGIPIEWRPYRNSWGNWVWRSLSSLPDYRWPGLKAPNKNMFPIVHESEWYWASHKEDK